MTTITITLSEVDAERLQQLATELKVSPEALVRATLNDALSRPEPSFRQAMEYVLTKNEELYRRLA